MAKQPQLGRLALVLAALLAWQGCLTTTSSLRQARDLFKAGDYDQAREILMREAASNPRDAEIKTLLFRAQLSSYNRHLYLARSLRKGGDRQGALLEYQKALAVFPGNRELQAEFDALTDPRKAAPPPAAKPTVVPPVQLNIRKDEKVSLSLKNTPITNIFKSLGKTFNINFIFDKDFRDFLHSLEIENTTFYEILKVLCMVSGSQYRVLDPVTVIVYPDIFAKKKTFDLRGIKTFYLSDIKAEDARKIVQTVFRDEQLLIQEDPNLNALVIRAEYNALADVERFLAKIDKSRSEVEIHIEILEINRSLINKLGADFASGTLGLSAGLLDDESKISSTLNVKDLCRHQLLPDHAHRGHELPGIGQQQQDPGQAQPARHRRRGDLLHGRRRSADPRDPVSGHRRRRHQFLAGNHLPLPQRRRGDQDHALHPPEQRGHAQDQADDQLHLLRRRPPRSPPSASARSRTRSA